MRCIFCNLNKDSEKIIFETDNFVLLESKYPITDGHSLLIPKKHLRSETEIDSKIINEYKKVYDKAYIYFEKKYKLAPLTFVNPPQDQSVEHLHKHFLPGIFGVLGVEKALRAYLVSIKSKR